MKRIAILAALFFLVPAMAHEAPSALQQDFRLYHDCIDDYATDGFGGDGYDLHTLDLREIYDEDLGNALVFRIILNGQGNADIDVTFSVAGSAKSYEFTTTGGSWTGTFDHVEKINSVNDGDRFALEGTVAFSSIGAGVGKKLSNYDAVGAYDSGSDSVSEFDGGAFQQCDEPARKFADANSDGTPDAITLQGPTQFYKQDVKPTDVTLQEGQEVLISLDVSNRIRQAQNLEFTAIHEGPGSIQFHDPVSGAYTEIGRIALGNKGSSGDSKTLHLVLEGDAPGTGNIIIDSVSNLGGHYKETVTYEITSGQTQSSSPSSSSPEAEETPYPFALGILAILWFARRT